MLEIQVLSRLGARHNEEQIYHDRLQRIPRLRSQLKRKPGLGAAPLEALVCRGGELKDAATEETEGATTLTMATYRPARAILENPDTGPHKSTSAD